MFGRIRARIAAVYLALLALSMLGLGYYLVAMLRAQAFQSLEEELQAVVTAFAAAMLVTSALAVGLAYLLARAIARPLQELTGSARRLAEGDLRQPLPIQARGEVGELAAAFTTMGTRLRHYIRTVEDERARLQSVLAHIPDGVVITDAEGKVTLLNPAAARLLRAAEASRGRPLIEVTRDHELAELVERALREAPAAADAASSRGWGPASTSRLVEVGPPGGRTWVQAIASHLPNHADDGPRVLLVLQDVAELRRTEAIRRDFVANVSHELRTPVASIMAMVEALEEGALDEPAVARDFLARMHVEVDGLIRLLEELLALSRIESGRESLRLQAADPGPIVVAAVERLRPQADRQGVGLDVRLELPRLPVMADPERLQQVVINLVHNAIKFTPPGGRIVVEVEPDRAIGNGDHDGPGEALIRVRDNGAGIPAEELERLFERFYKADKSRASGGTGLGLAIAKHLVQAHGGRIWADSAGPDRGATFTVALPAVNGAAAASTSTSVKQQLT